MNVHRETDVYFNVRIDKEKNGKECYDSISTAREDVARILAKALKADGFSVTMTRFIQKKTERLTWKYLKV